MWTRKLKALLASLVIGDGLVAIIAPSEQSRLWQQGGPEPYQRLMETFVERPGLTRVLSLGQVGLGLWIALRQAKR